MADYSVLSAAPPIHLIVYHLPPPPPGCLYAFTSTSYNNNEGPLPLQIMPLGMAQPFVPFCQFLPPFHPYNQEDNSNIASSKLSTTSSNSKSFGDRADVDAIHQLDRRLICNGASAAACEANTDLLSGFGNDSNTVDCNQFPAAPSYDEIFVSNSLSNADSFGIEESQHNRLTSRLSEQTCRPDSADIPKPSRFWCTKETGFVHPRFPEELDKSVVKWGESTSSSSSSGMTDLDAAIAQNKRFNKTPSFRDKKYVRTNSRNGCLWESGSRVDGVPESSAGSSCDRPAANYIPKRTSTKQVWRVREKPKELACAATDSAQNYIMPAGKDSDPNVEAEDKKYLRSSGSLMSTSVAEKLCQKIGRDIKLASGAILSIKHSFSAHLQAVGRNQLCYRIISIRISILR
ncbi:hypothetical protein GOP47_0023838 [Adiantum capillus-veneris]|uniref:Uncharacterized protein n=1 Tax=Adiantum capillus-veneris TaxID=13818 RepID=A0A9D4U4G7_ADICA|nr:hypothetical protein GOP47_0023838 [Adiantum capillus-veneris]